MDFSKLSDYQVFEISQNLSIDENIRSMANNHLRNRSLTPDQIKDIVLLHESKFKVEEQDDLMWEYKILLVIFPFFVPREISFTNKWLATRQKKKWRNFWFYRCVGYLIWTILAILLSRYFFDRK